MRSIPWIVGIILIVAAVGVVLLVPRDRPPVEGSQADRPPIAGSEVDRASQPARGERPRRLEVRWSAVEQISPIVGPDGTLVEALGIEMPDGSFQTIVERGASTPLDGSFTLATAFPEQRELVVHICRGNSDRAAENESLGWYRIEGIPPRPAGEALITLALRVADNAVLGAVVMPREKLTLELIPSAPPPDR